MMCKNGHELTDGKACRTCHNESALRHYYRNRERIFAEQAAYYALRGETKRSRQRERYAENPATYLERTRPYAEKNREALRPKRRQRCADYRARKARQFVESVDPQIVFQMHGGACGICEAFIDGPFEVDHIIPLSRGGLHSYANTQPAHRFCNRSKGARV